MDPARYIAARFSPLLNSPWLSEGAVVPDKKTVGALGERIAARWLWTRGCRILYRNYRAEGGGEIDIAARDGKILAFAEVKTRTSTAWGRPAQAVTPEKQALILRGAKGWLRLLHHTGEIEVPFRFDVIEVLLIPGRKPEVNWIRAAFNSEDLRRTLARRRNRMP